MPPINNNWFSFYKSYISTFEQRVLSLKPYEWWKSDRGINHVTGTLNSWTGIVRGTVMSQSNGVARPDYKTSNFILNNHPSVETKASGKYLQVAGNLSDWRFLHQTASFYSAFTQCSVGSQGPLFATTNASPALVGLFLSYRNVNPDAGGTHYYMSKICNGSGVNFLTECQTPLSSTVINTPQYISMRYPYNLNSSSMRAYGNGEVLATSGSSAVGSSNVGDPANLPVIGGSPGYGTYTSASISDIILFNRYLSDSEDALVRDYMKQKMLPPEPALRFGAKYKWRAQDALTSGSPLRVDTMPAYIGGVTLSHLGTGAKPLAPSASLQVNNMTAMPFASGEYGFSGTVSLGGNITMVSVGYYGASNGGIACITVTGSANSGLSHFIQGDQAISRGTGMTDSFKPSIGGPPIKCVQISVFPSSGSILNYFNSKTAATNLSPSTRLNIGDRFLWGTLSSNGVYGIVGHIVSTEIYDRALTQAEINYTMDFYGAQAGVAIT